MLRRIPPGQVRLGMYVHGVGGSWFDHPFWRRRFVLQTADDLARLKGAAVPYVIIDDELGTAPDPSHVASSLPSAVAPRPVDLATAAKDRERALQLMAGAKQVMREVFDSARLGKAVQSADVMPLVDQISQSVAINPQALLGVTRMKSKDEYTYLHSVAVCVLMVNFARTLGLDEATVRELGVGGLLHDIGKMVVPQGILQKPDVLTAEEFRVMKSHPEHGYGILTKSEGVPETALDICRHHHEKIDGTGYPFGLSGQEISLAARMGAICDVYDALTSHRPYKAAWTPVGAVTAMRSWKGQFDPDLLFTFLQSISIFPPGMLVGLASDRLGIVLDNARAANPRVLAFYSTRDRGFVDPETVTITDHGEGDQIVSEQQPENWGFSDWPQLRQKLIHATPCTTQPCH